MITLLTLDGQRLSFATRGDYLRWVAAGHRPSSPARPPVPRKSPGVVAMAKSFASSAARWVAAGMPLAAPEVAQTRLAICRACPDWSDGGNLGAGKCRVCGCSRLKHQLATERCPLGKW